MTTNNTTTTLVPYKSAKGNVYHLPERYAQLPTVSAVIRAMVGDGWSYYRIQKVTGILAPHCSNVMRQTKK